MTYLDTHCAIWLHAGELFRFSSASQRLIEADQVRLSPEVRLELQLLHEIGRLELTGGLLTANLERDYGFQVCDRSFLDVIDAAAALTWTRDPFDRLIVGQAKVADAYLVTKDARIRRHYRKAVW